MEHRYGPVVWKNSLILYLGFEIVTMVLAYLGFEIVLAIESVLVTMRVHWEKLGFWSIRPC